MQRITVSLILLFAPIILGQWSKLSTFPNKMANAILYTDSVIYVGSNSDGVYRSTDSMLTWQNLKNGIDFYPANMVKEILVRNGKIFIATGDGIYVSSNGGANWIKKSSGIPLGTGANYIFAESIFYINGALLTGTFSGIYRSTDDAESWQPTNISGQHVWAKNFTFHNGKLFAARETNNTPNAFISSDTGRSFAALNSLAFPVISYLSESGKLWAGTIVGVYLSTNDGVSWTKRSAGLSADPYNTGFLRYKGILFSPVKLGGSGIFATVNDGMRWIDAAAGLPFLSEVAGISLFRQHFYLLTSAGIYRRPVEDFTKTVTHPQGWNLVSAPLLAASMAKADLYPHSDSPLFAYENGYVVRDSLAPGKGYWLRFQQADTVTATGIPSASRAIQLAAGWNLIGPFESDVPVSAITTVPSNIITSAYYGYANGYTAVTSLSRGNAYWVRTSQSGSMTLP